jgi:hypothetical protein
MAQTKSSSTKRSGRSRKPQPRSRSSTSKQPKSSSKQRKSSPNGATRVDTARHAVEATAKDAGHAVGNAASKAKVPLLAGGAALAGAAGGMALGARHAHKPQTKVNSHDLAKAAKGVGSFGAQMGRLASELQRTREAANGGKNRSPLEVVLEGLTARRSRA